MKLKYIKKPELNIVADLRNGWEIRNNGRKIELVNVRGVSKFAYDTLEEFSAEWKTFKEPLLYGSIRESLKIWAEYNGLKKLTYNEFSDFSCFTGYERSLDFEIRIKLLGLKDGEEYDLTDLVGE